MTDFLESGETTEEDTSQESTWLKFEDGLDPIRNYFRRLVQVLFHPRRFFKKLSLKGGMIDPLVFALVTHWIGAAFRFIWDIFLKGTLSEYIQKVSRFSTGRIAINYFGYDGAFDLRDRALHWFWDTSPIILDPFLTLFLILFHAFWIFVAARILVIPGKENHPAEISYTTAVKIVCFGMCPAILNVIPVLGGWIVSFLTVIFTIIASKEVYRVSTNRAIVITLFPNLVFFGMIVLGCIFFLGTLLKWILMMFS